MNAHVLLERLLLRKPFATLGVGLLISVALCFPASKARPDFDLEGLLPLEEKEGAVFREVEKVFGRDDRTGFVLLQNDSEFKAVDFQKARELEEAFEGLSSVKSATSPATFPLLRSEQERVSVEDAMPKGFDDARMLWAQSEMLKQPYRHRLISKDKRSVIIILTMKDEVPDPKSRALMHKEVSALADALVIDAGFSYRLGGYPLHRAIFTNEIVNDIKVLTPFLLLAIFMALFAVLRSMSAVLLSVSTVLLSLIWTFGLSVWWGLPLNLLAQSVVVVVMVVGNSDSVHFLTHHRRQKGDSREALRETLKTLTLPCFLTTATTAASFLALRLSNMPTVAEFGMQVAIGVVSAFIITLLWVVPLLSLLKKAKPKAHDLRIQRFIEVLYRVSKKHATSIVVLALGLTLLGLSSTFWLKSNAGFLSDVRSDHPVHETTRILQDQFAGVISVDLLLWPEGEHPTPSFIKKVGALCRELDAMPNVVNATSVYDLLERFAENLNPNEAIAPETLLASGLMFSGEEVMPWYNEETRITRIRMTFKNLESVPFMALVEDVRLKTERVMGNTPFEITGQGFLSQWVNSRLVEQFSNGFAAALVVVLLLLAFFLRSLKLALLSLIPNLMPLAVIVLIMATAQIDLRTGSALALAVVFGLVVDDTIHFLAAYKSEASLLCAFESAGTGILHTSLILALGFCVLLFSQFRANTVLGLMVASAALLALLADLLVLPALLHLFDRKKKA